MPSGNATFTYKGDEPAVEVQGQTFPQGEAQAVTDNGIIAALRGRDDFSEAKAKKSGKTDG